MTARQLLEHFKRVIRAEGKRQQQSGYHRSPMQVAEEMIEAVDMAFHTWDHVTHHGGQKGRKWGTSAVEKARMRRAS